MTEPFEGIIGLLHEELELHRRLLALLREEQQALAGGRMARLAAIARRQEAIVQEVRWLEQARLELLRVLAERAGRDPADLTLSGLIAVVRPEVAARFQRLREALAGALREIAAANGSNAALIRDHVASGVTQTVDEMVGTLMTRLES